MIQEIIVGIVLVCVALWLIRRMMGTMRGKNTHPCNTCSTPCKLKDEINRNKGKGSKKCALGK